MDDSVASIELLGSTEQFVARQHFVVNSRIIGVPRIVSIGDDFEALVLDKREEPIGATVLCFRHLLKRLIDQEVIADLGGEAKAETTLREIWKLLSLQPNGETGVLLVNNYSNIFYIRDCSGELCAIHVVWLVGGWRLYLDFVDDRHLRSRKCRIFFRLPRG